MSIGHSGNVHVVFSHAISYSFPSAQLWFCSSHNPTSKSFEKFGSNLSEFCFAVQRVILGKLDDKRQTAFAVSGFMSTVCPYLGGSPRLPCLFSFILTEKSS